MNRIAYLYALVFIAIFCGCGETSQNMTFECEFYSLSYPIGYHIEEETRDGVQFLTISKEGADTDLMTSIVCESPGTFPSDTYDFVNLFTYKEMEDYKASNTFYDIMKMDSTFTIDGHSTYTTVSIFTEGTDTIIQSRTGLIIPQKLDLMIIQRVNTKKSEDEVKEMADILNTIKIKK